jgi:hypothetical protein
MAKVKEMKKEVAKQLTEEQLAKLQGIVKELNAMQSRIGDLESQKYELLIAVKSGRGILKEFQEELQKEYGDVNIDINTGAIVEDAGNS